MQPLRIKTADAAIGRWPGILQQLGIDSRFLRNRHGPCPLCGGKDRYRFDDKDGRGTWFCSHCGAGDGLMLVQRLYGWDFKRAAKEVDRLVGTMPAAAVTPARTEETKLLVLNRTWQASRPVSKGDPVWRYLNLNRRLGIDMVPPALRFHPALRYTDDDGADLGCFPAMLAKLRYPDGTGASIHRTYLTDTGEKAPVPKVKKTMPGKLLNTAAVWLGPAGQRLGIAEGIETALAASRRFGVPVWAATNAGLLESWVPPPGVEQVLIAGDNDTSYAGHAAAYGLAKRLVSKKYAVEVHIPDVPGKDWADESV